MKRSYKNIFVLGALFIMLAPMQACTPIGVAAGAGASLGIAAVQEGGIRTAVSDANIRLQIHDLWFKHNFDMYRMVDMTVKEGRVLVTGTVRNPDMRVDAVRLAWQAEGVRQVINEINVAKSEGVTGLIKDTWITGSLRTKLTFDKEVQSINYSIDTVKGTVYLMGIAQNEFEKGRVVDHARNMSHVDSVVSYVRLRGETPAGLQEPTKN